MVVNCRKKEHVVIFESNIPSQEGLRNFYTAFKTIVRL